MPTECKPRATRCPSCRARDATAICRLCKTDKRAPVIEEDYRRDAAIERERMFPKREA